MEKTSMYKISVLVILGLLSLMIVFINARVNSIDADSKVINDNIMVINDNIDAVNDNIITTNENLKNVQLNLYDKIDLAVGNITG